MVAHALKRTAKAQLPGLISLRRRSRRGSDGLTDRERAEMAREWNSVQGSHYTARQLRLQSTTKKSSSLSGF